VYANHELHSRFKRHFGPIHIGDGLIIIPSEMDVGIPELDEPTYRQGQIFFFR
jgi:hypothetical protein